MVEKLLKFDKRFISELLQRIESFNVFLSESASRGYAFEIEIKKEGTLKISAKLLID